MHISSAKSSRNLKPQILVKFDALDHSGLFCKDKFVIPKMKRVTSNETEKQPFISSKNFPKSKQLVVSQLVCEPCILQTIGCL